MAKIGETDPRWIVTERSDGTNVNNWHWTEKNCFGWAKERIEELFPKLQLYEQEGQTICIKEVGHVKGEMHINTRKGKTFHFFELDLEFKFEGKFEGEKAEGKISLPDVSFENDLDEHEVKVTVSNAKDPSKLRGIITAQGVPLVRSKLGVLLGEFKAMKGYLHDSSRAVPLSQPSSGVPVQATSPPPVPLPTAATGSRAASSPSPSTPAASKSETKPATATVKFSVDFRARVEDVFAALMDPRRVEAYTQSAVVLEPHPGGRFSLFGGNVTGEFVEVRANERIVQKWRASSWPEGLHSVVTIKFEESSGGVRLRLEQTGVPSGEAERTQQAWQENIFERIKRLFGYSAFGSPF